MLRLSAVVRRSGFIYLFLGFVCWCTAAQSPAPAAPPPPVPNASQSGAPAAGGPVAQPASGTAAQQHSPADAPEQRPSDEVATHDAPTTFKVRVNLVQVRVVVRDDKGNLIPNLHREDFQISDNRKPQLLSTFAVDTAESRAVAATSSEPGDGSEAERAAVMAKMPQRFVAMVFDDVHLSLGDATFVRSAGTKFLDSLAPSDRVGIYSTSGQTTQEFTDDREALRKALLGIIPRGSSVGFHDCPDVTLLRSGSD